MSIWSALTRDSEVAVRYMQPNGILLICWRTDYMPEDYALRAAALVRAASPTASIDLVECMTPALGCEGGRSYYFGVGIPARVH